MTPAEKNISKMPFYLIFLGRIEIKAFNYDWGGLCDDGFNSEEANIVCREAGYTLGAQEVFIGSQFGKGEGHILMDELDCKDNEISLLGCKFDPWNVTDCNDREWAGVSCRLDGITECDPIGVSLFFILIIVYS